MKVINTIAKPVFAVLFVALIGLIVIATKPKTVTDEPYTPGVSDEIDDPETNDPEPNTSDPTGEPGPDAPEPTGDPANNTPDPSSDILPEGLSPVYAYLDLAYEHNGEDADYLANPCAVDNNGDFTVTVTRGDDAEMPQALDGLTYMGIRLLDDDQADIDITKATISEVKVVCDGVELRVDIRGIAPYEDGVILAFFDCYDPAKYAEGTDLSGAETYDFSGKNTVAVTFTVAGAKAKQ